MKTFEKNDEEFVCQWCKRRVPRLKYSSRDHCCHCLVSVHVDINPGDRQNDCHGFLLPVEVLTDSKKGYIIRYRCNKCKQYHNNKAAADDDFRTLLSIMNHTYDPATFKSE